MMGDDCEDPGDLELMMDDTIDPLSRLIKYANSDFPLQRAAVVKSLFDTIQDTGFEKTVTDILPMFDTFQDDVEPAVRQLFSEQLPQIAEFFITEGRMDRPPREHFTEPMDLECPEETDIDADNVGYRHVLETVLPMALQSSLDKNADVSATGVDVVIECVQLLNRGDLEAHVMRPIANLAREEKDEEYRGVAAQLFNLLSSVVPKALTERYSVPELLRLCEDLSFTVRKVVALNLSGIVEASSCEIVEERILPAYTRLCGDKIWSVRKACVEVLPVFASSVSATTRTNQILAIFETFHSDVSRWVRHTAYQHLGRLLAAFKGPEITQKLLSYFTSMAFSNGDEIADEEMAEYCAYSLPAVAITIGSERWNEIEEVYLRLAEDTQWKVRCTLAASLHEFARILGPELTEAILTAPYELFMKDLDEVKTGVVKNLDQFLEVLPIEKRTPYMALIMDALRDADNWRIRRFLAEQMAKLAPLADQQAMEEIIVPLTFAFADDRFSSVRQVAVHAFGPLFRRLVELGAAEQTDCTLRDLSGCAQDAYFVRRQMFCDACSALMEDEGCDAEWVKSNILAHFPNMLADRVPNVRVTAARVVFNGLKNVRYASMDIPWEEWKAQLLQDGDGDVLLAIAPGSVNRDPSQPAELQDDRSMGETSEAISQDDVLPPPSPAPMVSLSAGPPLDAEQAVVAADMTEGETGGVHPAESAGIPVESEEE